MINGGTVSCSDVVNNSSDKSKVIQKHLVLLLHAQKCLLRDRQSRESGRTMYPCRIPSCQVAKDIYTHIISCFKTHCDFRHCMSSRKMMLHWKNCLRSNCPICGPLREAKQARERYRVLNSYRPRDWRNEN